MDIVKLITNKEFAFHRIGSLIIIILLVSSGMMALTTFLIDYLPRPWIFFIIWAILIVSIILSWLYNRDVFPKGTADKINLIIGIITEDESQKVRINNDTAGQIDKLLIQHGLSNRYKVKVLHNHLSQKLRGIIERYGESIKAGMEDSEDIRKFNFISNRMNARFFVYGDLIKRDSPNGKYLLSINALIKLSIPTSEQKTVLQSEFKALWKNEIKILESDELNGFRENAEHLFFTASYMLGLATFVDYQFFEGIDIWEKLEIHVRKKKDLVVHLPKVIQLKTNAYFLQSKLDHLSGEIDRAIIYRDKVFEIFPDSYNMYLNNSIREVKLRNRPDLALLHVMKASELGNGDDTWKYNKFYLEIILNDQEKALRTLDDILLNTFDQEVDCVNQVIAYNEDCIKNDPKQIQSYFIIGVFQYKKQSNLLLGYEQLEKFIESCSEENNYEMLLQRARIYIEEINKIIGIDKS